MKNFFQHIRAKLKKNEYTERFLQEIKDHSEDSIQAKMLKGRSEKRAQERALSDLGAIENIARNFNFMTHQGSLITLYVRGLLWGIFSILLYMNSLPFAYLPVDAGESGINEIIAHFIGFLILAFVIIGFSYILYSFAFAGFFSTAVNQAPIYLILYVAIVFLPPFLTYIFIAALNWGRDPFSFNVSLTISYFVLPLTTAVLTYFLNHKGILGLAERWKNKAHKDDKWFIYIANYILLTFIARPFLEEKLLGDNPLSVIFAPVWIIEFFLNIVGHLFVFVTPNHFAVTGGHWVVALFLSLTSVLAVIIIVQSRVKRSQIPWLYVCLITFTVPILFFPPLKKMAIQWNVPVSEISYPLESSQTWPFYSYISHQMENSDNFFHYFIDKKESEFIIIQSTTGTFALSDIQSVNSYQLEPRMPGEYSVPEKIDIPEEFSCEPGLKITEPPVNDQRVFIRPSIPCTTLKYKDRTIYEADAPLEILNLLVNDNEKWALLNVSSAPDFSAEKLYLVEL